MAARSLAARALRTALEALVFGDFIMVVSRQPLVLGAFGAELCCLAIGATAGASIYLCAASYYVDAA